MFQMPDIRDDLRTCPGMLAHTPKLWIPFAMLLVSFILAVLLTQGTTDRGWHVHQQHLPDRASRASRRCTCS